MLIQTACFQLSILIHCSFKGADCLRCFLLEMSGEVLSYCPLQDGAEINRACSYGWCLKRAQPGSAPPVILKSINPGRKLHSISAVTGVISLVLENPQENITFPSPNTYTPPNNSGIMHNDQLKDYNEFSDCFPQQSPVWVLAIMVWLVPFHYSRWLEVDLCFNHPLIELVRLNDF